MKKMVTAMIIGSLLSCTKADKVNTYFTHIEVVSNNKTLGLKAEIIKDSFNAENDKFAKIDAYKNLIIRKLVYKDMEQYSKTKKNIIGYVLTDKDGKEISVNDLSERVKDSISTEALKDFKKN